MNSQIVADSLASHSGKSNRREWHTVGAWLHPGERIVIVREDEAARKAATVKQPLTVGWKCPISHPGCEYFCGNHHCARLGRRKRGT